MKEKPENKSDILEMISLQIQENLHLDYKASAALSHSKRDEISKDVSAFANSDGGLIIYGVTEEGHLPLLIDGVDHHKYKREWLEQVINSNISPRIEGLSITQIPLDDKLSVYVLSIPKSFRGPHQAPDKKYYKRFNFLSEAMEDYEINDIRGRQKLVKPLINIEVELVNTIVRLVVENKGDSPANDVHFSFSDDFVWPRPSTQPKMPKLLAEGTKTFPPGRRYVYFYDSFHSLMGSKKGMDFDIEVTYFHTGIDKRINDLFTIDLTGFTDTLVVYSPFHSIEENIKTGFKDLSDEISGLNNSLKAIEQVSSPTGILISRESLANLGHVLNKTGEFEKLNPRHCGRDGFRKVLDISFDLSYRLDMFFIGPNQSLEQLKLIEGMNESIFKDIERNFILDFKSHNP